MNNFVNLRCKTGDFLNETERITFDFDDRNYAKEAMYMKHGVLILSVTKQADNLALLDI